MRKIFLLLLVITGCKHEKPEIFRPIAILNSGITINHHKNDSLHEARSYVLPIIYFDFIAINSSDSLFNLVINTFREENPLKLFVIFSHEEKKDTLVLTDFGSFKINKILPHDTAGFTIAGYIPDILPKRTEEDYSAVNLMKSIAENGEIYYFPDPSDQNQLDQGYLIKDTLHVKKSKEFKIHYKDPDDTTVE